MTFANIRDAWGGCLKCQIGVEREEIDLGHLWRAKTYDANTSFFVVVITDTPDPVLREDIVNFYLDDSGVDVAFLTSSIACVPGEPGVREVVNCRPRVHSVLRWMNPDLIIEIGEVSALNYDWGHPTHAMHHPDICDALCEAEDLRERVEQMKADAGQCPAPHSAPGTPE